MLKKRDSNVCPSSTMKFPPSCTMKFLNGSDCKVQNAMMRPAGGISARALLEERPLRRIITFCSDVDQILGGGIALGQLTEFCKLTSHHRTSAFPQALLDCQKLS